MPRYLPLQGDFVSLTFDPQSGHEQRGRRPAFVVSHQLFNKHTGLAIVCPVTNTDRHFPFHLPVPAELDLTGFVMTEQVKSLDYASRRVRFICKAPPDFLDDILELLATCFHKQ